MKWIVWHQESLFTLRQGLVKYSPHINSSLLRFCMAPHAPLSRLELRSPRLSSLYFYPASPAKCCGLLLTTVHAGLYLQVEDFILYNRQGPRILVSDLVVQSVDSAPASFQSGDGWALKGKRMVHRHLCFNEAESKSDCRNAYPYSSCVLSPWGLSPFGLVTLTLENISFVWQLSTKYADHPGWFSPWKWIRTG